MLEEGPDPKEVSHFHFVQLRTLRLVKANEQPPVDPVNVIASASKYGLLFVGISKGFKVLKLENILDLDEDKENKSFEENYFCQIVPCDTPVLLSLSADQKTLAVCVEKNSSVVADFYDIAAFADSNRTPVPFSNVQLSRGASKLREFVWNPVSENIYAYCMTDGSLGVQELSGLNSNVLGSLPSAKATAACWSPKGKQLVVGKRDGSFAQYKPNLQEVKSIPPPNLNEKLLVANICWLSTAQFAVVYMPEGKNVSPYLFIVSTPKGAPVVYINYYDVCLGNSTNELQRYMLHHEATWNILICASTDSIEVAVLGDPPSWVPWDLRDDGRILLPAKNGAKCAVGMGVMFCSQRRIVINENESYLAMPIIFILTDNGLLVSYHMVNTAPGCASLVRPSTPIEREGERKRPGGSQNVNQTVPKILDVNAINTAPSFFQSQAPGSVSSFPFNTGKPSSLSLSQASTQPGFQSTPQSVNNSSSFQSMTPSSGPNSSLQFGNSSFNALSEMERFHKPSKGISPSVPSQIPATDTTGIRHMAVAQRITPGSKMDDNQNGAVATVIKQAQPQAPLSNISNTVMTPEYLQSQNAYMTAIFEEMQTFDKEIHELKKSSQLLSSIGTKEEMEKLKLYTMNFEEFNNDMSETMVSLNSDIHSLKNVLLESFVMVEQANSRERRKNDHSYQSMLRDRALDPLTAKRMQKIEQHYLYLSTQLQEVNNKLDQDWFEYLEKKKENLRAVRHLSSAEAIYKTVVNVQNIIHNLRNSVNHLANKVSEKKLENLSRRKNKTEFIKRSSPEELSKLADAFLQAKITNSEDEKPQPSKKISFAAQQALRNYLSNASVAVVRPTVVYSPSQSRLLSKSLLFKNNSASETGPIPSKPAAAEVDGAISRPSAVGKTMFPPTTAIAKTLFTTGPPPLISSNETNEKKLMSINKPQVTSTTEFEKLRQSLVANTNQSQKNEQPKGILNTFSPKLPQTAVKPTTAQIPSFLTYNEKITSPVYEDITPPDTPNVSRYTTIQTPDNKNPPLSSNISQSGYISLLSGDSGTLKNNVPEHTKESLNLSQQIGKQPSFSFYVSENKSTPFNALSSDNTAPNTRLPSGDHVLIPSSSSTSLFSKAKENESASQFKLNNANTAQPFSFLTTSTPMSSSAVPVAKTEESGTSVLEKSISQFPKTAFLLNSNINLEKKDTTQRSELQKSSSNLLSSQVSGEKAKTDNPLQSVSFSPLSGNNSSSFFKTTDKTTSAPLSFSQSPVGSMTSLQSAISESTKSSAGLTMSSMKSTFSQDTTHVHNSAESPKALDMSKEKVSQVLPPHNPIDLSSDEKTTTSTKSAIPSILKSAQNQTATTSSIFNKPSLALESKPSTNTSSLFSQGISLPSGFPPSSVSNTASEQNSASSSIASAISFTQPVSPLATSQPTIPSTTSQLTTPMTASQSTILLTTSQSATPSTASQPATPSIVPQPATPSTVPQPATPSTVPQPSTPSTASQPAIPSTVSQPATPSTVPQPATPSTVPQPATPSTVPQPATPSTVPQPVTPLATSQPSIPLTTSQLSTPLATSQLSTPLATSQPSTPLATSQPASSLASSQPASSLATSQLTSPLAPSQPINTNISSPPVSAAQTTASLVFPKAATTTTQPVPVFGQANTSPSIFTPSPNVVVVSTAPVSVPGTAPATGSVFGQSPITTTTTTSTTSSFFSPAVTTQSSFFSKPASDAPAFGQSSPFGSAQPSGSFFSSTTSGQTSVFGGGNASGNTGFGSQSAVSNFSFGKSTFGQTQGSFGLAKSVFGQNTSSFGTPVSSPSSTPFGQSSGGSVFGTGSFFSGLGGQPNPENASKNVFSMGNLGKPSSDSGGSVFGGSTFGNKPNNSFSGGSFTSGGESVATSGFGVFQQQQKPFSFTNQPLSPKPSGFGAAPSFGGAPSFGSPPAFGSPPSFGSGSPLASVFGSQQGTQVANFSNFASENSLTFGSLASQNPGGFGSAAQQSSPFGGGSVFGGAPAFGGQSPGFGGSSGPPSNSSAFTQWRN
ncbi:nuclear pore complex protein Nup214 [Trichonephila clavata]|uniref:Nuclear pore complex protein Nup214 n=1 Tax=Trichonephila clavata TaxID=2740835 RepID=A0A8X6FQX2_TRICU|nr:nuclear pore complex protein Nup214 [Trichonephila clavata]